MNEEDIKHIIELYTQKRYKVISDRMIEVDSNDVILQVRSGRTLLLCSCSNDTKFCNESPMCRHKLFFIYYPLLQLLENKVDNLINDYKGFDFNRLKVDAKVVLDDLEKLKLKELLR